MSPKISISPCMQPKTLFFLAGGTGTIFATGTPRLVMTISRRVRRTVSITCKQCALKWAAPIWLMVTS